MLIGAADVLSFSLSNRAQVLAEERRHYLMLRWVCRPLLLAV